MLKDNSSFVVFNVVIFLISKILLGSYIYNFSSAILPPISGFYIP